MRRVAMARAEPMESREPGRPGAPARYVVGVMKTPVGAADPAFTRLVDGAVAAMRRRIDAGVIGLGLEVFEFLGPHLVPSGGAYAPLDFLQIGLSEKIERGFAFLLIVTEVDLATNRSYTLALPSRITNIGIVSTKRLAPSFWGQPSDPARAEQRLAALLLHTFGHLLNLPHDDDPENVMYRFHRVPQLDRMGDLTPAQIAEMRRSLPREARDEVARRHRLRFAVGRALAHWRSLAHTLRRANPLALALRLPTLITAALSVVVVILFSADPWAASSVMLLPELLILGVVALVFSTAVLYRSLSLGKGPGRETLLSESVVVTKAATILSLALTMLTLYLAFFLGSWLTIVTIFPEKLVTQWSGIGAPVHTIDHIKLSALMAALGVLAGSLGGAAGGRDVIRAILFLDEET